ncbi:MAG: PKD domain-containing protein [Euryarchaeota archaeon]|nr:PKD domain-containing protein [Euryarchaeota archaeon]
MRLRPGSVVALMMLVVTFAGCSGGGDDAGSKDAATGTGGSTPSSANVTAVIKVTIDGNETTPVNGTIAAIVGANLTFDGSGSNGTNLSFAWDFGDGATGSNASAVHAYGAPGLFDVTLTVSQGNATGTASLAVNVTAGGPAPGSFVGTDKKPPVTGTLLFGNPNAVNAATYGYDHVDIPVKILAAWTDGTPVVAKKIVIKLDGSGAAAPAMGVYWRDPAGANKATSPFVSTSNTSPQQDATLTYAADMPAGDWVIRVRLQIGVQGAYSVTRDVDYFAT